MIEIFMNAVEMIVSDDSTPRIGDAPRKIQLAAADAVLERLLETAEKEGVNLGDEFDAPRAIWLIDYDIDMARDRMVLRIPHHGVSDNVQAHGTFNQKGRAQ